jgi:hypothetical protein
MTRRTSRWVDSSRDKGGFIALPHSVVDSAAFQRLSHPAKSLLIELARQHLGDNNGRLLASRSHLATRGWKSSDVISRAKRELQASGFIHETVKGYRPNRASWYALTWYPLPAHPKYDYEAAATFVRSAYNRNAPLIPAAGQLKGVTAPRAGPGLSTAAPRRGPQKPNSLH